MERSRKAILVSHCLLNQSVRAIGAEKYPGVVKELVELCSETGIAMLQLPCPQVEFGDGLDRKLKPKETYDTKHYRKNCRDLSKRILDSVETYRGKNYDILGIIGVEFSSTCGVHQIANGSRNTPGKGILVEELENEMQKRNTQVPIIGFNLNNGFSSIEKLQSLFKFT